MAAKCEVLLLIFQSIDQSIVILNDQTSKWTPLNAGVPQDLVFGSILFLIYINVLSIRVLSNPRLFADDTTVWEVHTGFLY